MLRYLLNFILFVLPPTRFFGLRRFLLGLANIEVDKGASVCGRIQIFGNGIVRIGSGTWLSLGSEFFTTESAEVLIGENCDVGPGVKFLCGSHDIGSSDRRAGEGTGGSIVIGRGSWVGAGAMLLPGVEIGEGTVIAAGAVVKAGTYESNILLAGCPAKSIKELPS